MTLAHRSLRAAPRTGRLLGLVVAALSAAATLAASAAVAADPSPGAGTAQVLLTGPTGSRTGVPLPDPAALPDVATLQPLDTWGRDPGLAIAIAAGAGDGFASWEVTAVPSDTPDAEPMTLLAGVAEVPIPVIEIPAPAPGDWLVLAALVARDAAGTGTWAWRLAIPDRPLPEAFPVPDAVLSASGRTVIAERGDSCYLGTCGDVGGYPPDDQLPRLQAAGTDDPVTLTLSDGTGMASVNVLATRLDVPDGEDTSVVLWDGPPEGADHVLWIPAPGPGEWRLELRVRFDDERGDATYLAVIEVP